MSITSHQETSSVFLCLYLCLCLQEKKKKIQRMLAVAELFLSLTCAPVRVEVYLARGTRFHRTRTTERDRSDWRSLTTLLVFGW